jgi:hypothetical protein
MQVEYIERWVVLQDDKVIRVRASRKIWSPVTTSFGRVSLRDILLEPVYSAKDGVGASERK